MLPLNELEPLVVELNRHPAWQRLLVLLNNWVTTEAINALSPDADDFARGRIAGVRQLLLQFDVARLAVAHRKREEAEMREARRLDPLAVPGEYEPSERPTFLTSTPPVY